MGIMAFDESDRELLSNLDSKSDRDIELDAYGGNDDFMNLDKEMIEKLWSTE